MSSHYQDRGDVPPRGEFGSRYGKGAELWWAEVSVTRTKSRSGVASSICGPGRRKGIRSFVAGDSGETCHLNLLDPQSRSEGPTLAGWVGGSGASYSRPSPSSWP